MGVSNEIPVVINHTKEVLALLDTGSAISAISESALQKLFPEVEMLPLEYLMNIECADGGRLPYNGYCELHLTVPEIPNLRENFLFLVVPDTTHNLQVPLLIGTNILMPFKESCNSQHKTVPAQWSLAFKVLSDQDEELNKTQGRLAMVVNKLEHIVVLKRGERISVPCKIVKAIDCTSCLAMVHPTETSELAKGTDIVPSLINFKSDETDIKV